MATQCQFINNKGVNCRKKTRNPPYCHLHSKKIENKIEKKEEEMNPMCPICLEERELEVFECRHGICSECLEEMISFNCPMCRKYIVKSLKEEQIETIINNKITKKLVNILRNTFGLDIKTTDISL